MAKKARWSKSHDPKSHNPEFQNPESQNNAQRVRQLLLLQDVVKKINSILDLEQLLDEIVGSVAETFGCTQTGIVLKNETRDEIEVIALSGFLDVRKGNRFKIGAEGMVGHVAATGVMRYSPDVRQDPYYVATEASTLSEIDIPLICRGKLIGVFDAQSPSLDGFSPEQIELLCALADNVAIAVENARLFRQERLEKEKALREQDEARRIQRALLPDTDPNVPGYAIDGVCLQLSAVGGDWYDYIPLGDGKWGIALGDVCGKGTGAALLMAAARALLRRAASVSDSPSEVLARLNEALAKDLPAGRFVTMAYLVLESNGVVHAANAGHPPVLHMSDRAGPAVLEFAHGYPLGLMASQYSEVQAKLNRGDRMMVYSDGVVEAADSKGEEYGNARLVEFLRGRNISAKQLLAEVQKFSRGGTLSDDATAIVVRRV
jgi:sigma-B regulation protein RsbU (phosphoserine phosphatase)